MNFQKYNLLMKILLPCIITFLLLHFLTKKTMNESVGTSFLNSSIRYNIWPATPKLLKHPQFEISAWPYGDICLQDTTKTKKEFGTAQRHLVITINSDFITFL